MGTPVVGKSEAFKKDGKVTVESVIGHLWKNLGPIRDQFVAKLQGSEGPVALALMITADFTTDPLKIDIAVEHSFLFPDLEE